MTSSLKQIDDTIVAISTPPGTGGIGIVRFSGPEALSMADRMFAPKHKGKPSRYKSHTVHYGHIVDSPKRSQGRADALDIIDEVLLTVMRSPNSYTCEDVVEISCHGGIVPLKAILHLAVRHGARLAEPGEFTKRAFLNGRIDLIQAEAVLDIIQARTEAFLRVSANQLKGDLTRELEAIRSVLMDIYAGLEAAVNFPEEDIDASDKDEIDKRIGQAEKRVGALMESGKQGRLLKEGIKIVICGRTNVGKSSLLNVLVKEPRAITSAIPGTTRDTLEEIIQMEGIPLRIVDTAGIIKPRDGVEREALRRSRMHIKSAGLILFMLDAGRPLSREDKKLIKEIEGQPALVVINKIDLARRIDKEKVRQLFPDKKIVEISALKKKGIGLLKKSILDLSLQGRHLEPQSFLVSSMRHMESLLRCREALVDARSHLRAGMSLEFVSEDLKSGVNELDRITGRHADQDLLDQIFSSFCIGK